MIWLKKKNGFISGTEFLSDLQDVEQQYFRLKRYITLLLT